MRLFFIIAPFGNLFKAPFCALGSVLRQLGFMGKIVASLKTHAHSDLMHQPHGAAQFGHAPHRL
jgi:hypothetical protein